MIAKVSKQFHQWIWRPTPADAPLWRRSLVQALRITFAIARDLAEGQLNLRAMSLVYTTILSLVPLLAISFSILKGLGVHNSIEPLLLGFLEPLGDKGIEVTNQIIGFINNIKVGVLGSVGLGFLIFTVISLMQKIERAFNFTWRVIQERNFAKRFSDYLSVIAVGPVLVFSALALKASVMSNDLFLSLAMTKTFAQIIGNVIPYILIVAAFTFIYLFVPNTKVRWRSAVCGALVAGLLWEVVGWIFAAYVVSSTQYSAIYSAFATVIVLMIWLYLGWLILLTGAAVAFYHQHPNYARISDRDMTLGHDARQHLAFEMIGLIGKNYYSGKEPWTLDRFARYFALPEASIRDVIQTLEYHKLIARIGGTDGHYLPARPLEETPVSLILDAVNQGIGEPALFPRYKNVMADDLLRTARTAVKQALQKTTLKDLAEKQKIAVPEHHSIDRDILP